MAVIRRPRLQILPFAPASLAGSRSSLWREARNSHQSETLGRQLIPGRHYDFSPDRWKGSKRRLLGRTATHSPGLRKTRILQRLQQEKTL